MKDVAHNVYAYKSTAATNVDRWRARACYGAIRSPGMFWNGLLSERSHQENVNMAERPDGGRLFNDLARGDCLILFSLQSAFHGIPDAIDTIEMLIERGVELFFLDQWIGGPRMLRMLKETHACQWPRHRMVNEVPIGKKAHRLRGGRRVDVHDDRKLAIMRRIVELRDAGHGPDLISDLLEAELAEQEGREPRPRVVFEGPQREWRKSRIYHTLKAIDEGRVSL